MGTGFTDFGESVRKRREEMNMTQDELASACYVTKACVARIENGSLMPSLMLSLHIADALKTTVDGLTH